MHRLLQRQLKKIGYKQEAFSQENFENFITVVEQAYLDSDEDRALLENTLQISSNEMLSLYDELQKEAHNNLIRSEEKYGRLIENLNNHYFFYTHGKDGVFTYLSDSLTNILGYSKKEFRTHHTKYLSDDPINKDVNHHTNLSLSGVPQDPYKVSIYHKDGSICYLEVTELPVFDDDGVVEFIDGIARDITEQQYIEEKIYHLAKHDTLTSLVNRISLEEQLDKFILSREYDNFAVLFLDLDHFKNINDTLGHDIGDKLLQEVAKRIKPSIRSQDIFSRIGGDEFVIVLSNIDEIALTTILNKIMSLMRKTWNINTYEIKVSVSVGISLYPQDAQTRTELMKKSDIAMYKAKSLGRDNFCFFTDELNTKVHYDMQLEQDMAKALSSGQFELYYQPKQELLNDHIIGAEALIRWNHPSLGLIYPDQFIELSESTGFIIKLGAWIIEEACRAISRFNTKDLKHKLQLSINISTRQLQNDDVYQLIKNALEINHINPKQLSIEITESIMIEHKEKILQTLKNIDALGVSICMDDFGTGYSSLSYLHRLPIKVIKIDKAFVDDIIQNSDKKILLDTIIAMGKTLNMDIIAEGVEEEYQRDYLIKAGCVHYQGYLFSKALPEDKYLQLIKT